MTGATVLPDFEERLADAGGVRLRYFAGGSGGSPLVLLHGLGGGASNWTELAPRLALRHRVLVPELPGHGGSKPLPVAPGLNAYADRVGALVELEGALPSVFVGHSLGGLVALRLALRQPEAVAGIVLAAAAGISTRGPRAKVALAVIGSVRPGRAVSPLAGVVARTPWLRSPVFGWWGASDPRALSARAVEGLLGPQSLHTDTASAGRALLRDDPRPELDGISCPCLVLWGARDNWVPLEDGFEYARRLRAPLRVIPDCGHLLVAERPDACLDAIERFAASLSS